MCSNCNVNFECKCRCVISFRNKNKLSKRYNQIVNSFVRIYFYYNENKYICIYCMHSNKINWDEYMKNPENQENEHLLMFIHNPDYPE